MAAAKRMNGLTKVQFRAAFREYATAFTVSRDGNPEVTIDQLVDASGRFALAAITNEEDVVEGVFSMATDEEEEDA